MRASTSESLAESKDNTKSKHTRIVLESKDNQISIIFSAEVVIHFKVTHRHGASLARIADP